MFKKPLILLVILGGLILVAGLFISPGELVHVTAKSEWRMVKIELIKHYLIILGSTIVILGLIFSRLPEEKRLNHYLIGLSVIGIILIITGMFFSPHYSIENFSTIKFLSKDGKARLLFYQIITLIFGCLFLIVPLLVLVKRSSKAKKSLCISISLFGILLFAFLIKVTYINIKYPRNIIFKPGKYGKLLELILGQDILLSDFDPISTLKVKRKVITKAKYPVIDINFHLASAFKTGRDYKFLEPDRLVKSMDSVGVKIIVNTDGFRDNAEKYVKLYPDRFIIFFPTGFPPNIMTNQELANLPKMLEDAVKKGAKGDGEIWKYLGLRTRDETGKVIPVDDPRIDPLWSKAGELGIPILWHMIDVPANFQPIDRHNERYIMLSKYPIFSHYAPGIIPPRDTLIKDRENVFRKHPNTIFIGCHMGMNADDLTYVAYLLDTFPNYYVEISTVLSELGRQPYTARKFFIKYQDRILFGTDGGSLFGVKGWTVEKFYQAYFEFLETDNEYIKYPMQGAINQGSWRIYGINLPDSVLQKIYYKNAEKILNIKIN